MQNMQQDLEIRVGGKECLGCIPFIGPHPKIDANCPIDGSQLTYRTSEKIGSAPLITCRDCGIVYGLPSEGAIESMEKNLSVDPHCELTTEELREVAQERIDRLLGIVPKYFGKNWHSPEGSTRIKMDERFLIGVRLAGEEWMASEEKIDKEVDRLMRLARDNGLNTHDYFSSRK